jgi:hypothetical protein
MHSLPLFLALLISTAAFAETVPADSLAINSDSGSVAGEFEIAPTRDETIDITFQYGAARELEQANPEALAELATNIATVQSATAGQNSAIYFVPEGYQGPDLPEAINQKVHPQKVVVPQTLLGKFKSVFKNSYVRPLPKEKFMGVVFGATRATISGIVWFSAPGVSPELATLMTLSIGTYSGFSNVFNQTLSNLFAYGVKEAQTRLRRVSNSSTIMGRSMAVDFAFSNLLNGLSGMRNTFGQNGTNFLASGILGQIVGAQRNTMLKDKRQLNISYTLLLAPVTYTINALEATRSLHAVFNIGFYAVRPTMIATFAIYSGLIAANAFAKDKVIGILEKVDARVTRLVTRVIAKFSGATRGYCDDLTSGGISDSDHLLPN